MVDVVGAGLVLFAVYWVFNPIPAQEYRPAFLAVALLIVMLTSVAVLGNAMRALQEAAIIDLNFLEGWPILPIYLSQATGYYPTFASVFAQVALLLVYVVGLIAVTVTASRRRRGTTAGSAPALSEAGPATADQPILS